MAAREITPSFVERFRDAYDIEVQHWVDAAKRGEVGGPTFGMAMPPLLVVRQV